VLHYMGVIDIPLCRKPFSDVKEEYIPELKALAEDLIREKA
ncbi:N-acetylneuraminate lyase, partial [Escherichia coli]